MEGEKNDHFHSVVREDLSEEMTFNWGNLALDALYLLFFFFFLLVASVAYRSSQAKGQIRAAAASLCHSHSNAKCEPHF